MQADDDRSIFLSTLPAASRDRTAALAVVGVSSILFACAVPFAAVPLTPVPAFVASYQSALAVNDLITAILLIVVGLTMQHFAGLTFLFIALPFLMLFMAGIAADLFETRYAVFANAIIVGALVANAIVDISGLLQLGHYTSR